MKNFFIIVAGFLLLGSLSLANPVWALSDQMSLTGVVFNSDGELLTGTQNVTFRLYDFEDADSSIWEETQSVEFVNGIYAVLLGSATSFDSDLFSKDSLFLGIQIEGDDEMEPRITLSSVPWAMEADVANMALSLAENIVTAENISPGSIESAAIANGAIGASELASTGVTSGTYTNATITVDGDGRVTAASSGGAGAAGDITSVIAGPGLVGGGVSGDVVLFVATGGITSAMMGGNVVTADKIATDAVGSDEIAADAVGTSEITDNSIVNADVNLAAAILGTKISPDFGSQNIVTTGDISAGGGYKMMIGPFQEDNVDATKNWALPTEDVGNDEVPMPWAGSVVGISVACKPGSGVSGGTLTVEPTIDGTETGLEAVLSSAAGSNKRKTASQAKDTDSFSAGDPLGCKATVSSLTPSTLDCSCLIFVEM